MPDLAASQVLRAMYEKLDLSALGVEHAKAMKLQPYTTEQARAKLPEIAEAHDGFKIPYFDTAGKPTGFFRYRYLGEIRVGGFAALTGRKAPRYTQAAGAGPEPYLAPFIKWKEYAPNNGQPLMITEGELKAACACAHIAPTIGLGGVWNFRSGKKMIKLLPQLEEFNWRDRVVTICYDSDAVTNPDVMKAENALARELLALGAKPHIARMKELRKEDGTPFKKTGIDDYIAQRGADEFRRDVLEHAEEFQPSRELFKLNEEVMIIRNPGVILRTVNLQRMNDHLFKDVLYADRKIVVSTTGASSKIVEKSAARVWLEWPHHAAVECMTYKPGQPRITDSGELNTWRGWGTVPRKGDVRPWTTLMDYVFSGERAAHRQWFEQWLAYPLQYPGTKLNQAVLVWSVHQGTGKTLIGQTMGCIYGTNAAVVGEQELHASFNDWSENRQFIMGEEIVGGDKRGVADRLKSMITQKWLRINAKYVPAYTIPDCINYYFTSNHCDAVFMEDTDRRIFVHEIVGSPQPAAFYSEFLAWRDEQGGAEALFDYLMRLDLTGFDPRAHAPVTYAKAEMIETGRSDASAWVAALRESPEYVLRAGDVVVPYRLWTTSELYRMYEFAHNGNSGKLTVNGLARALRAGGLRKVYNGAGVVTKTAGQQRLWAIRGSAELLGMTPLQLGKLFDEERSGTKNVKF